MTYKRTLSQLNKRFPILALTTLSVVMAGCSSPQNSAIPASRPLPTYTETSPVTVESRLAEAARSQYPKRAELTLDATRSLINTDADRAFLLLNNLPYDDLSPELQAQIALQQARIAQGKGQNWEVFHWLDREPVINSKDGDLQAYAHILRAQTYTRFGEHAAALDEWLSGLAMLYKDERQQYYDDFWQTLLHTRAIRLQEIMPQVRSNDLQGWLNLALIYQPGSPLDEQLSSLKRWQQEWPGHPASAYLPKNFDELQSSTLKRPEKIAVLLPLSGRLSKAGASIRDGIIAASYQALAENENQPELLFYDTTGKDINKLAEQVINQGAELIIGPLTKTSVKHLSSDITARIPVLALNYIDDEPNQFGLSSYRPNLYQFGLSAEDEALMVAERGWLDGHRRAIVMTPETEWGKKINSTFTQAWIEMGGEIATSAEYPAKVEYSQFAGKALHTNQSQQRSRQLSRTLRQSLGFQPRRRQDVDMIFIGANPSEARQLKPALTYQFAGSIPVYSTSSAFSGIANRERDQDMNGIRIPVMPWLIPGIQTELEKKITTLWSQSRGQYGTLYALGADAYQLYPRLQQLHTLQGSQVQGLTGSLRITPEGKVQRELTWQIFRNGQLRPLPVTRQQLSILELSDNDSILAAQTF